MTPLACCYTDDEWPECTYRRLPELPMCQSHMLDTFRHALVTGVLPADVFSALIQQTDAYAELALTRQRFDTHRHVRDTKAQIQDERAQRREKLDRDAVVYYVRLTGDRIKIGWTGDLDQRLRAFRATATDLLGVEPGGFKTETRRHRQFAHLRLGRTEDFRDSPELRAHIDRLGKVES